MNTNNTDQVQLIQMDGSARQNDGQKKNKTTEVRRKINE